MTVFVNRSLKEVIKVEEVIEVRSRFNRTTVLIRGRGTEVCADRKGHAGTQQEDSHLQAKKRGHIRNQPSGTLIVVFRTPEL